MVRKNLLIGSIIVFGIALALGLSSVNVENLTFGGAMATIAGVLLFGSCCTCCSSAFIQPSTNEMWREAQKRKKKDRRKNIEKLTHESEIRTQKKEFQAQKHLLMTFQRIVKVSIEIKKAIAANLLGIPIDELTLWLKEWEKILPIRVKRDMIIVKDNLDSTLSLDNEFHEWETKEQTKEGKIEKFS
jgi:hypothetical protein